MVSLLCVVSVAQVFLSHMAIAMSLAGTRGLRNVQTAISSVQPLPELRSGPILREKTQPAKNLLRDLDSALSRGQGELSRMNEADRADQAAQDASRMLDAHRGTVFTATTVRHLLSSAARLTRPLWTAPSVTIRWCWRR